MNVRDNPLDDISDEEMFWQMLSLYHKGIYSEIDFIEWLGKKESLKDKYDLFMKNPHNFDKPGTEDED